MMRYPLPAVVVSVLLGLTFSAARADAPQLPSDRLFTHPTEAAHRFDDFTVSANDRRIESAEKLTRVRKLLANRRLDGVVIATERNFDWITAGGKDSVSWAQRESPVKLLITADRLYLIANNIEGPRVQDEELAGLGYELVEYPWHSSEAEVLLPQLKGKKVAFDSEAAAVAARRDPVKDLLDFQELYFPLTSGEMKKYRWLGRKTVEELQEVAQVIRPGMTEKDVQYLLARELWYWDIFPTVILSAVDDRIRAYRHPVVQGATLNHYVALNVCTRKWGLVVSTTRMVYFGEPDAKLPRAWQEGAKVIASMWDASQPGHTLGDVVNSARSAYEKAGFPEEWNRHHQGGPIFTLERLSRPSQGDKTVIRPGMEIAWNPTLQGS